jgi:hypothetical protein
MVNSYVSETGIATAAQQNQVTRVVCQGWPGQLKSTNLLGGIACSFKRFAGIVAGLRCNTEGVPEK